MARRDPTAASPRRGALPVHALALPAGSARAAAGHGETPRVMADTAPDRPRAMTVVDPIAAPRVERSADEVLALVQVGSDNTPRRNISSKNLGQKHLAIEIPADINQLQRRAPTLGVEWREVTRWAFTEALRLGYFVEEFSRSTTRDQSIGRYLLSYGS